MIAIFVGTAGMRCAQFQLQPIGGISSGLKIQKISMRVVASFLATLVNVQSHTTVKSISRFDILT